MGAVITRHAQGGAAELGAITQSPTTLYLETSGAVRKVVITRFEWMAQADYDALAVKYPTTLYIIHPSLKGRGTAHRWPRAGVSATAFYLGDVLISGASGQIENQVPEADRLLVGKGAWAGSNDASAIVWVPGPSPDPLASGVAQSSRDAAGTGISICRLTDFLATEGDMVSVGYYVRCTAVADMRCSVAQYLGGGWVRENGTTFAAVPANQWQWVTHQATMGDTADRHDLRVRLNSIDQGDVYEWAQPIVWHGTLDPIPEPS